ncbi:hypothetical protein ACVWXO_008065 [Bradyrhizobium sp. LM2.7]
MDLSLRKVDHPQAIDNYRVILKDAAGDVEVGSIGIKTFTSDDTGWTWGIDAVLPMRTSQTSGRGADRRDCMTRFRAAWDQLAADPGWLEEFLAAKRRRRSAETRQEPRP